jgi:tellurite resistance protein TerC
MDTLIALAGTDVPHKPVWMWAAFLALVLGLLAADLGIFHRRDHVVGMRESCALSAFYVAIGLAFGTWIWWLAGPERAMEYYTGFIVEKTLALDNIFVIAMIFAYFQVPRHLQHRVLFWGILGVIVLRGIMIGLGAALVEHFEWVLYIFGAFLIFTGLKMLLDSGKEPNIADNVVLKFLQRNFRTTKRMHGNRFFLRFGGKIYMTPLFAALVMVEIADAIFAVDSIPAIFAITTDPYVIYTSNIFAILGLRALYFLLSAAIARFTYLKYALSLVLVFIGSKIFIADFLMGGAKFPPAVSLGVTLGILAVGMAASLLAPPKVPKDEGSKGP